MLTPSLFVSPSRAVLHLAVGLGLSLISVPAAMAVTTAVTTASLSFSVSSPNGPVNFSGHNLNGAAGLLATPPESSLSYWNTGATTSFVAGDALGGNSFNLSSTVSGRTFSATAGVSVSVPPFFESAGAASSFNYVNIDTAGLISANDMYEFKFSSVRARLNLDLASDADGLSAFGSASWFVGLRYSLPGDTDGGSNTQSVAGNIGTDGSWSETSTYTTSFTFGSIPAAATNIQLYWEASAEARAVDGLPAAPRGVPDTGSTFALFGTGFGTLAWMRRKLRRGRPTA